MSSPMVFGDIAAGAVLMVVIENHEPCEWPLYYSALYARAFCRDTMVVVFLSAACLSSV